MLRDRSLRQIVAYARCCFEHDEAVSSEAQVRVDRVLTAFSTYGVLSPSHMMVVFLASSTYGKDVMKCYTMHRINS